MPFTSIVPRGTANCHRRPGVVCWPRSTGGEAMAQIFDGQIRFGIHAGPQHTGYDEYATLWQRAEAMGYDWASVFDHFIPINSDPEGPCFEGLTMLAAMAARTSRIR